MNGVKQIGRGLVIAAFSLVAASAYAQAQDPQKPFQPQVGQAGKDVVWVPTPQKTVDKMLELTKVTAKDYVMDLGSGNGITVISAAKKGATALGIEYNPDMVELSKRLAAEAGVSDKATFVQGRPVRSRPFEGDRHHDVPAARHQPASPAQDSRPEARHAHRVEYLHDGRLGA